MPKISLIHAAWLVLRKDWEVEWRTRARLMATVAFAFVTLLLFWLAMGPDVGTLRPHAHGYVWLALLLASVLSLGESFRIEGENQALTGLVLTPVEPRAIFLGKVFGNATLLFALSVILLPVEKAFYDFHLSRGLAPLLLVLFLGSIGISAPGTVYSAIAANARARDVMLPLLLFPVLAPLLIIAASATKFTFQADPQEQFGSWLQLLIAFDLIYLSVGFLIFPKVAEED